MVEIQRSRPEHERSWPRIEDMKLRIVAFRATMTTSNMEASGANFGATNKEGAESHDSRFMNFFIRAHEEDPWHKSRITYMNLCHELPKAKAQNNKLKLATLPSQIVAANSSPMTMNLPRSWKSINRGLLPLHLGA
ncbi:unnamed protein product [Linum trigynum]|uniref:Uncharacterized protein n=1 Tax=Linum trigynum TaxID=586398 RepID=A0AAV2CIJ0_9ROSI